MFIMTNINIPNDLIQVYDTKDGTNDVVRLSMLSRQIVQGNIKVYGLGKLNTSNRAGTIPIYNYGVYVCYNDAKEAFARYYQKNGYTREQALKAVGLA